jgi:decaprenylphospho-beta-D-erythro-pentofuranosid-2-ulose 2-reductase
MKEPILILGATSAIARQVAAAFARQGHALFLAGRDAAEVERLVQDLHLRFGVEIAGGQFDAEDYQSHAGFLRHVLERTGTLHGVVVAFGYLGEREHAAGDFEECQRIIARNYTGAVSILNHCAGYFEQRRAGFIIGISSVAGDPGRQSNYVYGSAKAGFSIYLQGLRNRLFFAGVRVLTIKPGFVDTPMTFGLPRLFLAASPEAVAEGIVRALGRSSEVVYLPWFWRWVMLALKLMPDKIRKRLKL